jgi:phage baseplate assembly protein V
MQRLFNALKSQAAALDASVAQPRFGVVSSVDPSTYTARVLLQPEGVLSGWLPVLTSWAGNGWGVVCPPVPGQQVLVVAQEGDAEHGVIVGCAFSTQMRPPAAPAGELWLVHESGSFLKLLGDGSIAAQATQFALSGTVAVTGNLTVSGTITDANGQVATASGG